MRAALKIHRSRLRKHKLDTKGMRTRKLKLYAAQPEARPFLPALLASFLLKSSLLKSSPGIFALSCFLFFSFLPLQKVAAQTDPLSYLKPVNTESPRETLRSFMKAMNTYRREKSRGSKENAAEFALGRALRTLDLTKSPVLLRKETGQETAMYLKEVIDRILRIDYAKVPDAAQAGELWRLAGTDIVIKKVTSGEREGEYLFSQNTVQQAAAFYKQVKDLPYKPGSGQGSGYSPSWLDSHLPAWLQKSMLELALWQWIALFLMIVIAFLFKSLFYFLFNVFLERCGQSTRISQRHILKLLPKLNKPLSYITAILFCVMVLHMLQLRGPPLAVLSALLKLSLSACLIWLSYNGVDHFSNRLAKIALRTESKLDDQLAPLLKRSLKVLTVVAGVLLSIQNLGVNVASLLAGLGLGGLAFALAARDTVANLFGSLMIVFDRPFQIGDWVIIGDAEGRVEDIGFRSTRIRTFYESLISIPNSEVASASIDNMGARQYRRSRSYLGLQYDTPPEKMEAFLEGIKNIIKANPYTRKENFHVVFKEYGDSGLIVMLYFFLKVSDWSRELLENQNIYLEIQRLAWDLGVHFAFPTQTLHVESLPKESSDKKAGTYPLVKKELQKIKEISQQYGLQGKRSKARGLGIFHPPFLEKKK